MKPARVRSTVGAASGRLTYPQHPLWVAEVSPEPLQSPQHSLPHDLVGGGVREQAGQGRRAGWSSEEERRRLEVWRKQRGVTGRKEPRKTSERGQRFAERGNMMSSGPQP